MAEQINTEIIAKIDNPPFSYYSIFLEKWYFSDNTTKIMIHTIGYSCVIGRNDHDYWEFNKAPRTLRELFNKKLGKLAFKVCDNCNKISRSLSFMLIPSCSNKEIIKLVKKLNKNVIGLCYDCDHKSAIIYF